MKVKKFPQSHLVITNNSGKKLIIDPGYLTFNPSTGSGQGYKVSDFRGADLYLITHQHADHLDSENIKAIVGESEVYGNSDVVNKLKEVGVSHAKEAKNGEDFEAGGFKITPIDLPHFPHPLGNAMPPNTGFIVDGVLFHAGDGYQLTGVTVDSAALPIGHPSVSTTSILNFAKSLNAKLIIPLHYDSYPRDPNELKKIAEQIGIEVRPLSPGEETEI